MKNINSLYVPSHMFSTNVDFEWLAFYISIPKTLISSLGPRAVIRTDSLTLLRVSVKLYYSALN
jgi:hypothetical protein